jgi:elongation factor P--(R)-beta-lysine ligase
LPLSDSWRPAASLEVLKLRAQLLARARDFFARRGVLEVETPILSAAGTTDPNLHSYATTSTAPGKHSRRRYLHTSPEFAMKRLLAAGSGSIYQICKVFRDNEIGRLHNPEFTMIEWYRVGYQYHQLMEEVSILLITALEGFRALAATEKLTYRETFLQHCGLDPHTATTQEMIELARMRDIVVSGLSADDRDGWRDLLLTRLVEPHLGRDRLTFIYDYPASAAALAHIRYDKPPIAERFEVYLDGVELANGFQELTDASEQRQRFDQDSRAREKRGLPAVPVDERLLAALTHSLPVCSGVALGFDRLVMLAAGTTSIARAMAFPFERA